VKRPLPTFTDAQRRQYEGVLPRLYPVTQQIKLVRDALHYAIRQQGGLLHSTRTMRPPGAIQADVQYYWGIIRRLPVQKDATLDPGDRDLSLLRRLTFNYLRHEFTDYDARLTVYGGQPESVKVLREEIANTLAHLYPWLAPECADYLESKSRADRRDSG